MNALTLGRKWQSPKTGFIHLCYEKENCWETIPIYENLCFILALFRSHNMENLKEGRKLLYRLLFFQNDKGGFPRYLHNFPYDSWEVSFHALLPLYWTNKLFKRFLDEPLQIHLEKVLENLQEYCLDKPVPLYLKRKLDATLAKEDFFSTLEYSSSAEYGHLLLSSELFKNHPSYPKMYEEIFSKWNAHLHLFSGSYDDQYQRGHYPNPTLLDLYAAHYFSSYPQKRIDEHPILLQSALIFPPFETPNSKEAMHFLFQRPSYMPTEISKGFHLFYLALEDMNIVCQEKHLRFVSKENTLLFTYPEERGKEELELKFFLPFVPNQHCLIEGERANTFRLGEKIEIEGLHMRFSLDEGEGVFQGHLFRSNRPSQIHPDSKDEAFDWCLGLRTIERQGSVTIRVQYHLDNANSSSLDVMAALSTASPIACSPLST